MNIREACEDIMGEKLASSIIDDMGIHWCVVTAMADSNHVNRPRACAAIRAHLAEQKRQSSSEGGGR